MRFMTMVKFDESLPAGPPPPAVFEAMGRVRRRGRSKRHAGRSGWLAAKRGRRDRVARRRLDQGCRRPIHRSQGTGRRVRAWWRYEARRRPSSSPGG